MSKLLDVKYYVHSGFSCAMGKVLCIFDYWEGEGMNRLPEGRQIVPSRLAQYQEVYVFISHGHPDHFSLEALKWHQKVKVTYVYAYDMEIDSDGVQMKPGDEVKLSDTVSVKAFDSTDLGVSFLVDIGGVKVFHAGDLNFWHWREESTPAEIDQAEKDFRKALKPLRGEKIDVAFFPVDPRQGRMYDAGANFFILEIKPRLLIPMHFWGRVEAMKKFELNGGNHDTRVIAVTEMGQRLSLDLTDDGLMEITIIAPERLPEMRTGEWNPEMDENDPFADSDLPVQLDDETL